MSKRYYLAPVVGDGTEHNPYRLAVVDYGVNHSAVIPTDPTTGAPLRAFGLAIVAAPDHAALLADGTIDALPLLDLDAPLSDLSSAVRTAIRNRLAARGIDVTDIPNSAVFRLLVRRIGRFLDAQFDERSHDVSD
jgi:hypothetical protein